MNSLKKIKIVVILFLFSSVTAFAQTKPNTTNFTDTLGRKQGHWVRFDENKKKVYDGNFINNLPDGKFTYFYPSGAAMAVTVFSQQGKVGYTQHFNSVGVVTGEGKYVNQQKDSLWRFYDGMAKIRAEETYLDGKKNGPSKVYYETGGVSEDKNYSNDLLNGKCTKFFPNGNIKSQRNYVMGSVEGKALYNYPSGKIYAEGAYKKDVKEGTWNFYKEDGNIDKKIIYINGKSKNHEDELIISKEEEEEAKKKFEHSDPKNER
jgi:antitoxin component YwqK of YwqJK toxin-antitoxin module